MSITVHQGDIPADIDWGQSVAIDSETMGLRAHRDRLCVVQLSAGDGNAHLVQFPHTSAAQPTPFDAPNLKALLTDPAITKIFHFARFDVAVIRRFLGVECLPIYCKKSPPSWCALIPTVTV